MRTKTPAVQNRIGYAVAGALIAVYLNLTTVGVFEPLALLLGAGLGYLFGRVRDLERRVDELQQQRPAVLAPPRVTEAPAQAAAPAVGKPVWTAAEPASRERVWPQPARSAPVAPAEPAPGRPPARGHELGTRIDDAVRAARHWLTTGNVPVKVGVIVSLFGVAFLLKYAVDRELIRFPIELRFLLVGLAGAALMVIGWRLRGQARVYGLSLQGGGAGILYLTIFTALRLFGLLSPAVAFALLIALTLCTGALAVMQNARALAVLGIVGGFLAPILVSTGSGSHVVLFSYYLLLNAAILGVAWFRAWRELNLIGFVFTWLIGGWWGYQHYESSMFGSTEPFVVLHFVFYQLTAILFAWRQPPRLRGVVDGTLVFGTPVIAGALQALLLADTEFGLAWSALAAAVFYASAAAWLHRARPEALRMLVEAFTALALAFATLAIPLAFDARWTSAAWALEGAALVWVGTRQAKLLPRVGGVLLVFGAGAAFLDHGWHRGAGLPLLNGNLLGGWLIALSALFSAQQLDRQTERFAREWALAARALFVWGLAWWLGTALLEIDERVASRFEPAVLATFVACSGALLTIAAQRLPWPLARTASFVTVPLLWLVAAFYAGGERHPLGDLGWVAWPLAVGIQYWILFRNERTGDRLAALAHPLAAAMTAVLLMWELAWQLHRPGLGNAWSGAVASLVPGAILLATLWAVRQPRWPFPHQARSYVRWVAAVLIVLQWLTVLQFTLGTDGNPAPLPYLPLLNPADLATAFALVTAFYWARAVTSAEGSVDGREFRRALVALGTVAFAVSTVSLLRSIHHLADVAWDPDILFDSVIVQAALSIYWGLLAFLGMIFGARRARRWLWLVGAGLMGLVVIKLFLVDLGNTGTVARIVSFIGIGALLLVVGYFSPVPPREAGDKDD
jgi:uncharacterized membrane protein